MTDRDDFTTRTKNDVAVRAGYHCSFNGCDQLTAGPSDEAPDAKTNIGEAAHICAAAPGGRRYDPAMTPEERSHISNAIWLCVHHSRLIDRDEATYTAEALRKMKKDHEAACAEELRRVPAQATDTPDVIGLGAEIVCTGTLLSAEKSEWTLLLRNFVRGDVHLLIRYFEESEKLPKFDSYVLVNALGDGRVLSSAPSLHKGSNGSYEVHCPIDPSFPRTDARTLGKQWALSPHTGDLHLDGKGQVAEVSGVESLPQVIRQVLSSQRGELFKAAKFGVRFSEYFESFADSPWLSHLLKMELIRQAAIPYQDHMLKREYTPLQSVERVHSIEFTGAKSSKTWLPVHVDLDVNGVGRWQAGIEILVPDKPQWPPPALNVARR